MPKYVTLVQLTDQGIRNIKDTTKRARAFKDLAEQAGLTVHMVCWTQGSYDLVTVVEGDEEAATAVLLRMGATGNIRSETLRAFDFEDMDRILAKIP